MKTIAITNQKGGVGKTTTTQHLAAAVAGRGRRVLAVDMDPQANLTMAAHVDLDAITHSLYSVMVTRRVSVADIVIRTEQGYDLVPGDPDLEAAEKELPTMIDPQRQLRRALLPLASAYDLCLIDCPPRLGSLTVNALTASDGVLIPVSPEMWPMRGVQRLQRELEEVSTSYSMPLEIIAIVPTMVGRNSSHRNMLERMHRLFSEVPVSTPVPHSPYFARASEWSETVFDVASQRHAGPEAYQDLADRVLAFMDGLPAPASIDLSGRAAGAVTAART